MHKKLSAGSALLFLTLFTLLMLFTPAYGGGWAVVTLDELPAQIVANQPVTIGFVVRQHGRTLLGNLQPPPTVTLDREGETAHLVVSARDQGSAGHYQATFTLLRAGQWKWSIKAFGAEQTMPKLTVLAAAELATWGRDLFVAKGCAVCHTHEAVASDVEFTVASGPDLTHRPLDANYLKAWLKDPSAIKPNTDMPNLGLNNIEIEALIAFLTQTHK